MSDNLYANNSVLLPIMIKWKEDLKSNPETRIPEELGKAIIDIATGLSKRWNFSRYTEDWKQDMVQDGILATVSGLHNFDIEKYNNVYGYINKACWSSFLARIHTEKAEVAKKQKSFLEVYDENDDEFLELADNEFVQDVHTKLAEFEEIVNAKKNKNKVDDDYTPNLEDFL